MQPTTEQIRRLREEEPRVALATLVATRGTSPKKEGAKMWVGEGGRILGAVTLGGCMDARVIMESEAALATRRPRLCSVDLGEEEAWDLGLTCRGTPRPPRSTMTLTTPLAPIAARACSSEVTRCPFTITITSPGWKPAAMNARPSLPGETITPSTRPPR